jgi:predicted enzyme related to lactoylglutathione lyase
MKGNAVGWFEIYVENMPRAKKFYESVFETKLEKLEIPDIEMWSFSGNMTSYGAPGALVKMPGFPVGQNSVVIYFSCQDCKLEEKKVTDFGGKVKKSKFSIGRYGFISLVIDTEGNLFGLHSLK